MGHVGAITIHSRQPAFLNASGQPTFPPSSVVTFNYTTIGSAQASPAVAWEQRPWDTETPQLGPHHPHTESGVGAR
jgi:hypothetical protein